MEDGSAAGVGAGATRRVLPWVALVAVYLFWGSTYLAIRVAVETIPPFLMAGVRFLTAGLLLYPAARRMRGASSPTPGQWRGAAVVAALMLVGGNGLVTWAEQTVPSGIAALLVATVPLWMVVFDRLSGGQRLRWQVIVGLALGFAGLIILLRPAPGRGLDVAGAATVLVAAVLWAAGSVRSRSAALPSQPLVSTGMQMICGGAILVLIAGLGGEFQRLELSEVTAASLAGFTWLVTFGSIVGFSSYVYALKNLPTATVATYAYVNPVVAVMLGWAILNERLDAQTVAGGAVIAVAVALIVSTRSRASANSATEIAKPSGVATTAGPVDEAPASPEPA